MLGSCTSVSGFVCFPCRWLLLLMLFHPTLGNACSRPHQPPAERRQPTGGLADPTCLAQHVFRARACGALAQHIRVPAGDAAAIPSAGLATSADGHLVSFRLGLSTGSTVALDGWGDVGFAPLGRILRRGLAGSQSLCLIFKRPFSKMIVSFHKLRIPVPRRHDLVVRVLVGCFKLCCVSVDTGHFPTCLLQVLGPLGGRVCSRLLPLFN